MFERRIPEWLRHAPVPNVNGFAILAGVEAAARGILISVMPIAMYRALEDPETVQPNEVFHSDERLVWDLDPKG